MYNRTNFIVWLSVTSVEHKKHEWKNIATLVVSKMLNFKVYAVYCGVKAILIHGNTRTVLRFCNPIRVARNHKHFVKSNQ